MWPTWNHMTPASRTKQHIHTSTRAIQFETEREQNEVTYSYYHESSSIILLKHWQMGITRRYLYHVSHQLPKHRPTQHRYNYTVPWLQAHDTNTLPRGTTPTVPTAKRLTPTTVPTANRITLTPIPHGHGTAISLHDISQKISYYTQQITQLVHAIM